MVPLSHFIEQLVRVSEKGAQIARLCRKEPELFKLLIQEKFGENKNPRFVQDFKTLADVLVQETIVHDLNLKFPGFQDNIKGEENNVFTNSLNETITVKIQNNQEETSNLLVTVLDGNVIAANLLAKAVHSDPLPETLDGLPNIEIDLKNIGIWIDPIDSTSEYINGDWVNDSANEFSTSGLNCVTCLIGAYDKITGNSLVGVVNQPFGFLDKNLFKSRIYWGFNMHGCKGNNFDEAISSNANKIILVSGNEDDEVINRLNQHFKVKYAAGAGYKLLCVALGLCDGYLTTKSCTFKWDVCGPHGLLMSVDGHVISFDKHEELNYQTICENNDNSCNKNGLIVYRDRRVFERIKKIFF